MKRTGSPIAVLTILMAYMGAVRAGDQSPAFEVASVKLSKDQQTQRGGTGLPPPLPRGNLGTLIYTHVTLKGVLARAYALRPYEVAGPDWIDEKFYDIVAKPPNGVPAEQVPAMLQALLAERFRMRVHWDTREESGYALVVGKSNLNLTKSAVVPGETPNRHESISPSDSGTRLVFKEVTLEDLAKSLTFLLGRPVTNRARVEGVFDIALECSSDSLPGLRQMTPPEDSPPAPSIITAIRRLGLDLTSGKVPVKRLTVDSAQAVPTEN